MSMIILLKYYIKVVWFFKYNFGEQFRKNTVFLLAKCSVLWYNKYRKEREVHKMTQFEKDVKMFTEYLKIGIISYFMVKYEEGIFIIETDDEKFYYDEKTGRELS